VSSGASLAELRDALRAAGARPRHEALMLRAWVRGLPLDAFAQSEDAQLPLTLRRAYPKLALRFATLVGSMNTVSPVELVRCTTPGTLWR